MVLDYPRKRNGMYILSKKDMEHIADRILRKHMPEALCDGNTVDIVRLAEEILHLRIEEITVETDDNILGALIIDDASEIPYLDESGLPATRRFLPGTILVHIPFNVELSEKRKRFTIVNDREENVKHPARYDSADCGAVQGIPRKDLAV